MVLMGVTTPSIDLMRIDLVKGSPDHVHKLLLHGNATMTNQIMQSSF